MAGLDDRIVRVGIGIGNEVDYYEGLYITARGTRYGNENANECQVKIDNLTRAHRDFILTKTSPFLANNPDFNALLIVEAGRKSYGVSQIFIGNITVSDVTQPPDIGIILNAITGYNSSLDTRAISMPGVTKLSTIAQTAAQNLGTNLNFQATDKSIANYSFTGTPMNHVSNLSDAGGVDAFVDNQTLVVKDLDQPLPGLVKDVNMHTGMIGIPELTENGVRVRFLLDNDTHLGGLLNLTSLLNPSLNGRYVIQKLSFDITSRDVPFYWIAECGRLV